VRTKSSSSVRDAPKVRANESRNQQKRCDQSLNLGKGAIYQPYLELCLRKRRPIRFMGPAESLRFMRLTIQTLDPVRGLISSGPLSSRCLLLCNPYHCKGLDRSRDVLRDPSAPFWCQPTLPQPLTGYVGASTTAIDQLQCRSLHCDNAKPLYRSLSNPGHGGYDRIGSIETGSLDLKLDEIGFCVCHRSLPNS